MKIHLALKIIIISQDYFIKYINQSLRNMILKIIRNLLTIFLYLFFGIRLKILNMIKFAIIFGIINHNIIFLIS